MAIMATATMFTAAGLDQVAEVGSRKLPGRGNAEEDSGQQGYGRGKSQDGGIHVNGGFMREGIVGKEGGQGVDAFVGGKNAEGCARDGQNHGFGEQLANEAAASRAHGNAYGQFVLPGRSAREKKDGDVGAADDQQS